MSSDDSGFDELSTVLRVGFDPSPVEDATFVISVVEGPDRGKQFTLGALTPSRVLVGQSPACDIRLSDPSVSRRHASLEPAGRRVHVTDLGSRNGTFVHDVAIVDGYVQAGVIRMGSTALEIALAPATGSPVQIPGANGFGPVVGASTEMRRLYPLCARIASADVPVIIEGETGTGKEVLAEAIHRQGPRASGPFVVFDCTAVPPNLVESELFGHERGSFTGAISRRIGVFERAHGGTLLIDEIGDLDLAMQPKLLRAIERSEVQRIGGDRPIRVDVRFLAATRRDLDREVARGRFRDDLFHRLAVARVELPPLRRRRGDVQVLARHFCQVLGHDPASLDAALLLGWADRPWPGNVRELRNAVARHLALGDLAELPEATEELPAELDWIDQAVDPTVPLTEARQRVIEEFERRYIEQLLQRHEGNVTRAAQAAGVAKRYFQLLKARGTKPRR